MHNDSRRASPLPPDDRRRSIIEAVTPLILEHGPAVTTRLMAEAAGVSEGTLFKVFPDKAAILLEAIRVSLDPAEVEDALADIPDDDPIENQLAAAVEVLTARGDRLVALVSALGAMPREHHGDHGDVHRQFEEAHDSVLTALAALFARHAESLTVTPRRAAVVLRGIVFVNSHPSLSPSDRLSADDVVATLLHGVAAPIPATSEEAGA